MRTNWQEIATLLYTTKSKIAKGLPDDLYIEDIIRLQYTVKSEREEFRLKILRAIVGEIKDPTGKTVNLQKIGDPGWVDIPDGEDSRGYTCTKPLLKAMCIERKTRVIRLPDNKYNIECVNSGANPVRKNFGTFPSYSINRTDFQEWWKSAGENASPSLSLWLKNNLKRGRSLTIVRKREILRKILNALDAYAKANNLQFDRFNMPVQNREKHTAIGFDELCHELFPKEFIIGNIKTMNGYRSGICQFARGLEAGSFYKDSLPFMYSTFQCKPTNFTGDKVQNAFQK